MHKKPRKCSLALYLARGKAVAEHVTILGLEVSRGLEVVLLVYEISPIGHMRYGLLLVDGIISK